jgi:hypothetical protein
MPPDDANDDDLTYGALIRVGKRGSDLSFVVILSWLLFDFIEKTTKLRFKDE